MSTNPNVDPDSSFFERVLKPTQGRTLYADMRRMEVIVMASDLDWTIVHPAGLVDMAATGRYHVAPGYVVPHELTTARADLADLLLRALASGE